MAQIPSYTTGSLKLSDYLIGTDVSAENVTRSMPVSDIVASILAAKTIGTVTSISTSNSAYIDLAGGPITITGTLIASLSASGTPSSATYLRGDGTWAEPGPTPTDIISQNDGNTITSDTTQWKFAGTGVTASAINDNVQVEIPGLLGSVDSVLNGVAITATGSVTSNPSTGNVTVTNSGVYQARAGGNITLSGSATPLPYSSAVTVNTTSNVGTITNVNPGQGTEITNASTNAEIDIDYAGLDNFILANADTASSDDIIAFQDLSASEVKTAKLNTIPASTLTSIKTTIDDADTGKVQNIDTFTDVWKAKEMVTLTISEYNAICPGVSCNANTLYLIVGPGTAYTATLNPTYNVTGGALGVGYTTTVEVNDGTGWVASSSLTAVAGTTYEFRITLTLINGYTLSSGSLTASTGTLTMPSSNTTDNLSITAVIAPPPTPQCTVTLNIIDSTGGIGAGQYTISGNQTGDTVTVDQGAQYTFSSTATVNSGYYFSPGPTYLYFTGTAPAFSTAQADAEIGGTILQTTYSATLTVVQGNTLAVTGDPGGTLSGSGISYSYQSNTPNTTFTQTISGLVNGNPFSWNPIGVAVNANYSATAGVPPVTFSTDAAGSSPITFPYGGTMASSNQSLTIYSQGNIVYTAPVTTNSVEMNWTSTSITDNSGSGYTLSPAQNTSSGNASVGSTGWTIAPGTASVILPYTGQYFSSGGTPVNSPTLAIDGTAAMPASPPSPATSDWSVTGTIDWIPVTIKVTYTLNSNATYYVTFSGQTSHTFTLFGSGVQSQASFLVSASNTVPFALGRTGATWCTTTPYGLCFAYSYGCGSSYGCSVYIPEGNGSWQAKLNGTQVGAYYETFTKGGTNLSYRQGTFSSLAVSDVLEVILIEN